MFNIARERVGAGPIAAPNEPSVLGFGLASLATWRLGHLLAEEDGPGDAVVRVREWLGTGSIGELMDCFYCMSIWISAPLSLVITRRRRDLPMVWLAVSGAACLLERVTAERAPDINRDPEGALNVLWPEAQCGEA